MAVRALGVPTFATAAPTPVYPVTGTTQRSRPDPRDLQLYGSRPRVPGENRQNSERSDHETRLIADKIAQTTEDG